MSKYSPTQDDLESDQSIKIEEQRATIESVEKILVLLENFEFEEAMYLKEEILQTPSDDITEILRSDEELRQRVLDTINLYATKYSAKKYLLNEEHLETYVKTRNLIKIFGVAPDMYPESIENAMVRTIKALSVHDGFATTLGRCEELHLERAPHVYDTVRKTLYECAVEQPIIYGSSDEAFMYTRCIEIMANLYEYKDEEISNLLTEAFIHPLDDYANWSRETRIVMSAVEYFGVADPVYSNPEVISHVRDKFVYFIESDTTGIPEYIAEKCAVQLDVQAPEYPHGMTYADLIKVRGSDEAAGKWNLKRMRGLTYLVKSDALQIIAAQGDGASHYFHEISKGIPSSNQVEREEIEFYVYIAKKYGVQARSVLVNLVNRKGTDIADQKADIDIYMASVGVPDQKLLDEFKHTEQDPIAREALVSRVNTMKKGAIDADSDSLWQPGGVAVLYSVFPPTSSVTSAEYQRMLSNRCDYSLDANLSNINNRRVRVPTGRLMFESGAELDRDLWDLINNAIENANTNPAGSIDSNAIALKLIKSAVSGQEADQDLIELLYRFHLQSGGAKVEPAEDSSYQSLARLSEFVRTEIAGKYIPQVLQTYSQEHAEEWAQIESELFNRVKKTREKDFARVKSLMLGLKKSKNPSDAERSTQMLQETLEKYALSIAEAQIMDEDRLKSMIEAVPVTEDEDIQRSEDYYNSPEFHRALDKFEEKYDRNKLAIGKIRDQAMNPLIRSMNTELGKFTTEGDIEEESRELELIITKKHAHSIAGFNMGVCTVIDEDLWDNPNFMNCILVDRDRNLGLGGMHLFVAGGYLTLPGINPSNEALSNVELGNLTDQMLEYSKEVARALNLRGVLIPTDKYIASNRSRVYSYLEDQKWPKLRLPAPVHFATVGNTSYEIRDCWVVK